MKLLIFFLFVVFMGNCGVKPISKMTSEDNLVASICGPKSIKKSTDYKFYRVFDKKKKELKPFQISYGFIGDSDDNHPEILVTKKCFGVKKSSKKEVYFIQLDTKATIGQGISPESHKTFGVSEIQLDSLKETRVDFKSCGPSGLGIESKPMAIKVSLDASLRNSQKKLLSDDLEIQFDNDQKTPPKLNKYNCFYTPAKYQKRLLKISHSKIPEIKFRRFFHIRKNNKKLNTANLCPNNKMAIDPGGECLDHFIYYCEAVNRGLLSTEFESAIYAFNGSGKPNCESLNSQLEYINNLEVIQSVDFNYQEINLEPYWTAPKLYKISIDNLSVLFLPKIAPLKNLELNRHKKSHLYAEDISNLEIVIIKDSFLTNADFLAKRDLFPQLEILNLENNKIKSVKYFSNFPELYSANFSRNNISHINMNIDLPNLSSINLAANSIDKFTLEGNFKNLKKLYLTANSKLNYIDLGDTRTSLKEIGFARTKIDNLEFLEKAPNVKKLELSGEHISDISGILNLQNLEDLNIEKSLSSVKDWSPLGKLTPLIKLKIGMGNGKEFPYIKNLLNLEELHYSYPQLKDISILRDLTNLKKLSLEKSGIENINPIANLASLNTLGLSDNNIKIIPNLEKLVKLHSLNISNSPIQNLEVLNELENLKVLNARNCDLSDITSIAKISSLEELDLWGNNIKTLPKLSKLNKLKKLNLTHNKIENAEYLNTLGNSLQVLKMLNSNLTTFPKLDNLINLRELDFSYNEISHIDDISYLKNLKTLDLSFNMLTNTDFLKNLEFLELISLRVNEIVSLSGLKNLSSIRYITLHVNKIESILELKNLDLDEDIFYFWGNPLGTTIKKTIHNCPFDAWSSIISDWCLQPNDPPLD